MSANIQIEHQAEIDDGKRFSFGENWKNFLESLNEDKIKDAEDSLKSMLEAETLEGKTFLDIGSGSGLFSLAARRLGASVTSFDYDTSSVGCTQALKERFMPDDPNWLIYQGSVLDSEFLKSLGHFDIVYSWGVLHHTGDMWAALENVDQCVSKNGRLFIALYNFQPFMSRYWTFVKKTYNRYRISRPFFIALHFLYPTLPSIILKTITGRKIPRGMNIWHDLLDWLGGYPFEVSKPEEIFEFYKKKGYTLEKLNTVGGKLGCNEYVFIKNNDKS